MQGDSAAIGEKIEEALAQPGAVLSAAELARSIGAPLARVSYAILRLEQLGRIERAGRRAGAPARERLFRARRRVTD